MFMCYLSYFVPGALTEEEILRMDNEVRKNRKNLRYGLVSAVVAIQFVAPSIGVIVPLAPTQIERQINQPSEKTEGAKKVLDDEVEKGNQQELLVELRGGGDDLLQLLIKFLWLLTLSQTQTPTEGFQPRPPHLSNRNQMQRDPRIAPRLKENPVGRNNPGQGNSKVSKQPSLDELANSLSPEYAEYQSKYYSDSLPKRFDTKDYSVDEFENLAKDPRTDAYTRVSIDEARAALQADRQNIIIEPTRPDKSVAKNVDLDYEVSGPAPFTHVDIKTPIGSEILRKQRQLITIEEMGYNVGQKIVDQKHRFVGKKDGPVSAENVGHIVDLCYVPPNEKIIVREAILQGARDRGSDTGIIFLNEN